MSCRAGAFNMFREVQAQLAALTAVHKKCTSTCPMHKYVFSCSQATKINTGGKREIRKTI